MAGRRKKLNITLIIINIAMTAAIALILCLPHSVATPSAAPQNASALATDSNAAYSKLNEASADNITAAIRQDSDKNAGTQGQRQMETRPIALSTKIEEVDPRKMHGNHPFSAEAQKILSGRLEETDSLRRRQILNYCEHFRTAYTTRDIDFLRQVFSENALIIVGNVVNSGKTPSKSLIGKKASYSVYSKAEYLRRLERVFDTNRQIKVNFSDFKIMRHPTADGIYGVTLRQKYESDRYSDSGVLFLLWDFRNPSMPAIHVRTWQDADRIADEDDAISIEDFNLE